MADEEGENRGEAEGAEDREEAKEDEDMEEAEDIEEAGMAENRKEAKEDENKEQAEEKEKKEENESKEESKEKKEAEDPEMQAPIAEEQGLEHKLEFPEPFYCKITQKIMSDPVVVPDGDSYERSAIEARGDVPKNKMYSNRALLQVIDETVELSGNSIRAGLKRLQKNMQDALTQVIEKSAIPSEEYKPLPDVYYCPITFSLIHVPVIDPEGNTYEKAAIQTWIQANGSSPITRTDLSLDDLYPNNAITDLLDLEKARNDQSIHPSIRKWKQEEPPSAPDLDPSEGNISTDNPPSNFPTTDEMRDEERRRHIKQACTCVGIIFVLAAIVALCIFVPSQGIIWALVILCCCCSDRIRNR